MKYLFPAALLVLASCSSSSPTAPTPPPATSVTPPVITAPPVVVAPPHNPLLDDPNYSVSFYRAFVRNAYESPQRLEPLRRQSGPPSIYLKIVDEAGNAIDALTLNATQSAIESTTGQLTGAFGIARLERGVESREGVSGWITVKWLAVATNDRVCGRAPVGGTWIELNPRNNCRCAGGPAVSLRVIKHELGHALGFWHTDARTDLMFIESTTCDQQPSAREVLTARIAYTMANGSTSDPQ